MTTNDLRAAAERVRRVQQDESLMRIYTPERFDWEEACGLYRSDNILLARAYLASHPADGETEIDEAWLVSVGGDNNYDAGCVTFTSEHGDTIAWLRSVSRVFVNGRGLHKPVKTRSDLRGLCRELGIPLKEEKEA